MLSAEICVMSGREVVGEMRDEMSLVGMLVVVMLTDLWNESQAEAEAELSRGGDIR